MKSQFFLPMAVGRMAFSMCGPLAQCVVDGFAHEAAGQEAVCGFQAHEGAVHPCQHGLALACSRCCAEVRAGPGVAQPGFEGVEVLEVGEEPCRDFGCGVAGFVKLAAHVGQAACEDDGFAAAAGKAVVGLVAVALEGAVEVGGDDVVQARRGAAGFPMEDRVAVRNAAGPQVAEPGLSIAGREIADGRFIYLDIAAAEHVAPDLLIDRLEPFRGQRDPFGHRLARQPDLVARPVDRFLPVERKMIAIFAHDDLREEPRCHEAALQERIGQRRDDGHGIEHAALHILGAHRAPAQEARGFIVEPFAELPLPPPHGGSALRAKAPPFGDLSPQPRASVPRRCDAMPRGNPSPARGR